MSDYLKFINGKVKYSTSKKHVATYRDYDITYIVYRHTKKNRGCGYTSYLQATNIKTGFSVSFGVRIPLEDVKKHFNDFDNSSIFEYENVKNKWWFKEVRQSVYKYINKGRI